MRTRQAWRVGGHRAGRHGDLCEAGGLRGVEGHATKVPPAGLRVSEEVLRGAGGEGRVAFDQRLRRRVGRVVLGAARRQPTDRDATAGLVPRASRGLQRWGGEGGERPGEGVVASQPSSVPRLPLRRPQSAGVARESGARGGPGEGRGPGGFSAMAAAGRAQRPASASASRHVPSSQQLAGSRPSSAGSSREASVRQILLS